MLPFWGRLKPLIQLNKVDFPDPFDPISENISLSFTEKDTSSSATTPENCIRMLLIHKSAIRKKASVFRGLFS
jgi:hypothetical protein